MLLLMKLLRENHMHNQSGLKKHMHVSEQDKVAFRTVTIAVIAKLATWPEQL